MITDALRPISNIGNQMTLWRIGLSPATDIPVSENKNTTSMPRIKTRQVSRLSYQGTINLR